MSEIIGHKNAFLIKKAPFYIKNVALIWVFTDFIVFLQNNLNRNRNKIIKEWEFLQNYSVVRTTIKR